VAQGAQRVDRIVRVGVITTSYPRHAGDSAGHFVASLNRWLNRQGVEVEVLAASADRGLFYRGGAPSQLPAPAVWPEALAFSLALRRASRRASRRWDAVISHWLAPCGLVADGLGLPHVAVAHGSDVALLRRLPFGAALVRRLARRADLIYVAAALQIEGAPGRVVPMGVELASVQGGDPARSPLLVDGPLVLVMSRLVHDKGIDRAIAALPPGMTLAIAGEGPERARLQALAIGRSVHLLGNVEGEPRRHLLARADVLAVPSRIDGAPTVIAEAAAVGLPIVATAVGGIVELAAPGLVCVAAADLGVALGDAVARGRRPPAAAGAWPDQEAQAMRIFAPLLRRVAIDPASNCCETVTVRI